MFSGRRAEWNGGWEGYDAFPYTVLSEADFSAHLTRLANSRVVGGAHCASFQPFPAPHANQDRYAVLAFDVPGSGEWKMWAVFDGACLLMLYLRAVETDILNICVCIRAVSRIRCVHCARRTRGARDSRLRGARAPRDAHSPAPRPARFLVLVLFPVTFTILPNLFRANPIAITNSHRTLLPPRTHHHRLRRRHHPGCARPLPRRACIARGNLRRANSATGHPRWVDASDDIEMSHRYDSARRAARSREEAVCVQLGGLYRWCVCLPFLIPMLVHTSHAHTDSDALHSPGTEVGRRDVGRGGRERGA